jgi:hypothetical protein
LESSNDGDDDGDSFDDSYSEIYDGTIAAVNDAFQRKQDLREPEASLPFP